MFFASPDSNAVPLYVVPTDECDTILDTLPAVAVDFAQRYGFSGALGQGVFAPDGSGGYVALVGFGTDARRRRGRFHMANGLQKLPADTYRIVNAIPCDAPEYEILGCVLAQYRFDRYKQSVQTCPQLVQPDWIDARWIKTMAEAEMLCRDLINTPPNHMGPAELEDAVRTLAASHDAAISVITGDELITQDFPMIHTVGAGSSRAPRLIDMTWGTTGPKVTLVGKGVCFDTGGLNLKTAASMGLMKKDMGGAANTIGLAAMIMGLGMDVQLRLLIPAVENSVSGTAYRPQDVLTSRKGLTVEINNTDAEGRLVLADALTYASEDNPDLIISMATLTGAARVAVGPDLSPFFSGHPEMTRLLSHCAAPSQDPVWEMPFWDPYEKMIEPDIADLDNAPGGGMAGAITAALFLRRFVNDPTKYLHFDVYGWTATAQPARPKGGALTGARALHAALTQWVSRHGSA